MGQVSTVTSFYKRNLIFGFLGVIAKEVGRPGAVQNIEPNRLIRGFT